MGSVLVICTANQCRSPVAGGFLAKQVEARGLQLTVNSAGLLEGGVQSPSEIVRAATMFGLDLSGHRSRQIDVELLDSASLVIGMTRSHVREVAVRRPTLWRCTFTIRELVRRGGEIGPRPEGISLEEWLAEAHGDRAPQDLMGAGSDDDVTDPMGGVQAEYNEMAENLYGLTHELAELLWPSTSVDQPRRGRHAAP